MSTMYKNKKGETIVIHAEAYGNSEAEAKAAALEIAEYVEKKTGVEFVVDAMCGTKPFFRFTHQCKDRTGKPIQRWRCFFAENRGIETEQANHPSIKVA